MSKGIDKFQTIHDYGGSLCKFSKQIDIMEPGGFRKLNVRLRRQPLVNQRPWWIAGLLLATIILLLAVWSYYHSHKKQFTYPTTSRG